MTRNPAPIHSESTAKAGDKPLGTIQIDVDELWVYYESIGRSAPAGGPSQVYQQGIPRLLDLFDRYGIRATFFVCGRDVPAQAQRLAEMVRRGHEIANHSTWHRNGFARLSFAEKRADIATTHRLIEDATGQPPVGFKSPGFSFAADQLEVLAGLGYLYDSSLLPTPYAPLLRGLQRILSGGHVDPTHYGRPSHGLAPLHPYRPDPTAPHRPQRTHQRAHHTAPTLPPYQSTNHQSTDHQSTDHQSTDHQSTDHQSTDHQSTDHQSTDHRSTTPPTIWESPVTTLPVLRLPMHSTFVLSAGRPLFDVGLRLAQARRVPMNYLLHAADVVDASPDPALASYKFLVQSWAEKRPLYEHMLAALSQRYRLVPTREFVAALGSGSPHG